MAHLSWRNDLPMPASTEAMTYKAVAAKLLAKDRGPRLLTHDPMTESDKQSIYICASFTNEKLPLEPELQNVDDQCSLKHRAAKIPNLQRVFKHKSAREFADRRNSSC